MLPAPRISAESSARRQHALRGSMAASSARTSSESAWWPVTLLEFWRAKGEPSEDAGSPRIEQIRGRPRTKQGEGLQPPEAGRRGRLPRHTLELQESALVREPEGAVGPEAVCGHD